MDKWPICTVFGGLGGVRTRKLNQLADACLIDEQMLASESLTGYLNDPSGMEAFASVVCVHVRFYLSPYTKQTFRASPLLPFFISKIQWGAETIPP